MKLKPIKNKEKIATLFNKGRIVNGKNISIKAFEFQDEKPGYVISVPKKNFPLAVDRNLVKRRLRVCLAKMVLPENTCSFFLLYSGKILVSSDEMLNDLIGLFRKG